MDNFESVRYQTQIQSGVRVNPWWILCKQVENDLYFGRAVNESSAELVKIDLTTLGNENVHETVLNQVNIPSATSEDDCFLCLGFLDGWDEKTHIAKASSQSKS